MRKARAAADEPETSTEGSTHFIVLNPGRTARGNVSSRVGGSKPMPSEMGREIGRQTLSSVGPSNIVVRQPKLPSMDPPKLHIEFEFYLATSRASLALAMLAQGLLAALVRLKEKR